MTEVPERLQAALADRYSLERELGRGGSAIVYLADDLKHGRKVAVKVMHRELAEVLGRERFLQEIQTTARLEHPHILSLYDSGEADGFLFFVMPYVKDESLRDRLDRVELLPIDRAVQIAREVAGALEYSHSLDVIHRDIKPSNILLSGGHAILTDFGIAKALTEAGGGDLTSAGISVGTAHYMSPEQAAGDQPVDARSDVYSLGAVLYEMLVGQPPFDGRTAQVVLGKILTARPARPRDVREAIPDALDGAIMRALSRLPSDRFSSAEHFQQALVTLDRRHGAKHRRTRPVALPILATVTVLAVAWGAWASFFGPGGSQAIELPRPSPFLTGAAIFAEPAWSPTGSLIAYVSDEEENQDIWVADPSGDNAINLTSGSATVNAHPAWSPDGNRLAFISDRDGGGLYTMSALGGDLRRVAPVVVDGSTASSWVSLQWAADGTIVYTSRDTAGTPQVYRVGEDRPQPVCMTCDLATGGGQSGHLLPDGNLFVFRSTEGPEPDGELYITDLTTGATQTIGRDVALPKWSVDLERLLYVSSADGALDLWAMQIDLDEGRAVGTPQRLTGGLGVGGLAVGPPGRVLVALPQMTSAIWALPIDRGPLSSLDAGEELAPPEEFRDARPRWISDTVVVFQSDRRGSTDLYRMATTSRAPSRLTTDPDGSETSPHPSPDGSWIAYEHAPEGVATIRIMRASGGAPLSPDTTWASRFQEQCCPNWSPDGTRLAMSVTTGPEGPRLAIAVVDPLTGSSSEIRLLDVPGVSQQYPRWSPDGRLIAYEARGEGSRWAIWVIDADGSNPRRVTQSDVHGRQPTWAPDQSTLFYRDDFQHVWRVTLDADANAIGEPERFLEMSARHRAGEGGFDVRGNRLLLAVETHAGDLWLLEFLEARRP